jgi:hypothetical protein
MKHLLQNFAFIDAGLRVHSRTVPVSAILSAKSQAALRQLHGTV